MKKYTLIIAALIAATACNDDPKKPDVPSIPIVDNAPASIAYQIVKDYPHDPHCFTEGLQYVDGKFYESAGNYGESDIRITDPATGKLLQSKKLGKEYFGEGITVLNGKAYQMTYKENTAFVYDAKTLQQTGKFTYNFGEGWGMTTDGKNLIISNGSSNLYFVDPTTFKTLKSVGVYNQYGPVASINELEYIKGFVYANIWQRDMLVKINPASGKVVGTVDLSDLRGKYGYPSLAQGGENQPETLNGIAYDSTDNKIFITGKNWPKIFEVKLDN
ncbi:MAG: glutaminyl-peptide cyclotransferase [Chitinophagaceae bacterium]